MRAQRGWTGSGRLLGAAVAALLAVGVGAWESSGQAQDPAAPQGRDQGADPAKDKDARGKNRRVPLRLRAPREPGKGVPKGNADPLVNPGPNANGGANANPPAAIDPNGPLPELGTYHYRLRIGAGNSENLAAVYYPSKLKEKAPVVVLVHERDRSSKDFEDALTDLKGISLAESLQKDGYAVLAFDLRGHGGNARRELSARDWINSPGDLEVAYLALIDRHNRGELNLAKLGVVALGEGANLAASWAAGGGGVSSEGRTSDLGALILVSPMADAKAQGLRAAPNLQTLAARVPIDLMVGERDVPSFEVVDAVRPIIKRQRANQVEIFPSALHAYQLLRLEPGLTGAIAKFLEATIKNKPDEWEGRYLLEPVRYSDIKVRPNPVRPGDPAATKAAPR